MNQAKPDEKLFTGFDPVTAAQWQQKVAKDLRGQDPESLHWHTYENLDIKPFYTKEDTAELPYTSTLPGTFPFVGSRHISQNKWCNLPEIAAAGNGHEAVNKAVTALSGGADGVNFIIQEPDHFDQDYLMQHLDLNKTFVAYTFTAGPKAFFKRFFEKLHEKHISPNGLKGFINFNSDSFNDAVLKELDALLDLTKNASDFYGITINGSHFSNSGASTVQEIAFTLSAAVSVTDSLTSKGTTLEAVLRNINLHLSAGTNYFFEIAKLRAIRLLWSAVVQAYQAEQNMAAKLRIHTSTARWTLTTFDPYVNLLRATTEAMSAVIGGSDSLTVIPFDATYRVPQEFSERIARNISTILKEESYLDKAIDPAAGSYYIESLTHELAENAWNLFKDIEAMGGYSEALKKGFIREEIDKISRQKFANIASGKDVLVGTNKYPNRQEKTEFDPAELIRSKDFDAKRAAYPYEVMRIAALTHYQKKQRCPLVTIVSFTDVQRHSNASFAREFFSCAGFDTQVLQENTVEEAINELAKIKPTVVVMAASDDQFADFSAQFMDQYRLKINAPALVLAAHPQHMIEEMRQQGFDGYIFEGCETDSIISHLQKALIS